MFQINPYRYNCEIIKKFFAKAIILIISILFFLSFTVSIIVDMFANNLFFISVSGFISVISFLRFYITSKSKKEVSSFNEPANLLIASSIISIVTNSTAFALSIIYISTFLGTNLFENQASYISIGNLTFPFESPTLISYLPIFLFSTLSAIALLILCRSIKKSSSSIYLYKKGSSFFAVTSFALTIAQIILIIYYGISIQSIVPAIRAVLSLTLAVFSIMYNRYITNVSSNVFIPQPKTEKLEHPSEPTSVSYNHEASTYDTSLVNMWTTPVQSVEPPKQGASSSFVPQPAFGQAGSESEPQTFTFCSSCGSKCMPDTLFCGKCGNKLTN